MKKTFLTKSRYVNGLQCAKWIWLFFNRPEGLPKFSKEAEHMFNEEHKKAFNGELVR